LKRKHLFFPFLLLAFLLSLTVTANAAAAASGTCGTNLTWALDAGGVLTVSGTGSMTAFTSETEVPWHARMAEVTAVRIGSGVTDIGAYAFYQGVNIASVTFPDGLLTIGSSAFDSCTALTSVTVPASVTSIGDYAFAFCSGLSAVTLGNPSVAVGVHSFQNTPWKESRRVDLANCTVSLPQTLYAVTKDGTVTPAVTVTDGAKTLVKDTDYTVTCADNNRPGTASVTVTGINDYKGTRTVTFQIYASGTCGSSLTWLLDANGCLTVSGTGAMQDWSLYVTPVPWSTWRGMIRKVVVNEGAASVGKNSFSGCTALESVTLPATLRSIGENSFSGCTALSSVALPDGLTQVGAYAFFNCTALTSVTLPDSLTDLGAMAFSCCTALTGIQTGAANPAFRSVNGILFSKDMTALLYYPAAKADTAYGVPIGVTVLSDYAFYKAEHLTAVMLPAGLTTVKGNAFQGCTALKTVNLPASATSVGAYAFDGCSSLLAIALPKGMTSVEACTFRGCAALQTVTLPDELTSVKGAAFYNCDSLAEIVFPAGLSEIQGLAFFSSGLSRIYFRGNAPAKISGDVFGAVTASVFFLQNDATWTAEKQAACSGTLLWANWDPSTGDCSGTYADIFSWTLSGKGVFTVTGTGSMPYAYKLPWSDLNDKIVSVVIAPGVTGLATNAFKNCTALKTVTLPAGLTSIGGDTFEYAASLTEITFPDSVNLIGSYAFYHSGLKAAFFKGNAPSQGSSEIFPSGTVIYRSAGSTGWDTYEWRQYSQSDRLYTPAVKIHTDKATGGVVLNWDTVCGAVNYEVYRSATWGKGYVRCTVTTGLSFTDPVPSDGKLYYYRVRAMDGGKTASSDFFDANTAWRILPLVRPTVTTAVSFSTNAVKVTWNPVAGAEGYVICRATAANGPYTALRVLDSRSVEYVSTALTMGKPYYYRIQAFCTVNGARVYGALSAVRSARPMPNAPDIFQVVSESCDRAAITWWNCSGAAGYVVYRAFSPDGPYTALRAVSEGMDVVYTFTNTGLTPGRTCYYKVQVFCLVNGSRVYGAYSKPVSVRPVLTAPEMQSGYTSYNEQGSIGLHVSWMPVTGAAGYVIYRAGSEGGPYMALQMLSADTTAFINRNMPQGRTYYYKVQAFCLVGGKRIYSNLSAAPMVLST